MSKTVVATYSHQGEEFQILVDSDLAYDYITGKIKDPMKPLQVEEIFKDANKGEKQSQDKIKKIFNTVDLGQVVDMILKKGHLPITTEQRAKMLSEKRKAIVNIIAVNSIDPRTNAPHPPARVDKALDDAKVQIDPFKNAQEQVDAVVKKINMILPIKFAVMKVEVTIPPAYANRCFNTLKQYGMKSEEWQSNGSLKANLEFPAGLRDELYDKLNGLTKGEIIIKTEA